MTRLNPKMDKRKRTTSEALGEEVFTLVQDAQGRGFLSDGINFIDDPKRLFGTVRFHLKHTEDAAKILRKWLRKYGEL